MGGRTLDQFRAKQKLKAEKSAKTGTKPTRETDKETQKT
jgi:hypothetical protein